MTEATQAFLSEKSLLTLGGASMAVVAVSKTLRTLFKWDSPWPAFIVSVAVCFTGAYSLKVLNEPLDYLVNALNACLLFCTALGMNETAGARRQSLRAKSLGAEKSVGWWSSWLK